MIFSKNIIKKKLNENESFISEIIHEGPPQLRFSPARLL